MEDLQATLQSILTDPEQMAKISAIAESMGLKPPEGNSVPQTSEQGGGQAKREAEMAAPEMGLEFGRIISQLAAMSGSEERVLSALRPTLSPAGQGRVDRALRAAKLSRLAGQLLRGRREGNV